MKIGVLLKQVPASDSRVKINGDQTGIVTDDIKWEINPYDEFALEAGIQLKEAKVADSLVLITLGGKDAEARVKDGLARAVKAKPEAIRVDGGDFAGADSLGIAKALAAAIKKAGIDLVLTGKQAIDNDNAQVPAMVAELLDLPQVTCVEKLEVSGDSLTAHRVMGGGQVDVVKAPVQAIVTCDKGLNEPRFASLPGIMKAKRAKIAVWGAGDLGVDAGSALVSESDYREPPARPAGQIIEGASVAEKVDKLVNLLQNEAKVL